MISIVRQFVAAINAGDVPAIAACMTEGHRFIDATGAAHSGRETMRSGWEQYLAVFPDYRIEIEEVIAGEATVAAFGWATGSFHGGKDPVWRIPAAFKATIRGGLIDEWRVYADIEPMMRSMGIQR